MSFQNMDRVGGDRALGELVHLELRREAGEQLLHLANLLAIAHLNNIDSGDTARVFLQEHFRRGAGDLLGVGYWMASVFCLLRASPDPTPGATGDDSYRPSGMSAKGYEQDG